MRVRDLVGKDNFIEVFCRCPLEICGNRDVKGIYRRARTGEIKNFTGISSLYEEPDSPDLVLDTNERSLEECVQQVLILLEARGIVTKA